MTQPQSGLTLAERQAALLEALLRAAGDDGKRGGAVDYLAHGDRGKRQDRSDAVSLFRRTLGRLALPPDGRVDPIAPGSSGKKGQSDHLPLASRHTFTQARREGVTLDLASRLSKLEEAAAAGETALNSWLLLLSLDPKYADVPRHRVLPVRLYAADAEQGAELETRVELVLRAAGLDIAEDPEGVEGSWKKWWRAKTRDPVTRAQVQQVLDQVRHAVELRQVEAVQADVNDRNSLAVARLMASMDRSAPTAVQIGSILLLSVPGHGTIAKTLSARQMMALEERPDWLGDPDTVLARLRQLPTPAPATDEDGGKGGLGDV